MPRWTCPLALLALLPLAAEGRAGAAARPPRPNVLLIITDDQGYGDLSCHGSPVLKTPNLDRLHGQSVRLTNFHVDPTCAPTRAALLTGRYSSRTGVWHTIAGRSLLRRDEVTLADALARAGYRTGAFGKWHLGDSHPYRPQDRGFQKSVVLGGGGVGQTPDAWGNTYFDDTYRADGTPTRFKGYCTDVFFAEATKFIEAKSDQPFFCYLATICAHAPYNVAEKWARPYAGPGVPPARARFQGMIANIDHNVGRLMARLRESKREEDTLVIFLTDNGTAEGHGPGGGFNAGMRGSKGSEYEGGHRVPCFLRLPGALPAGRDVPNLTAHIDLQPTILDLCRVARPEGPKLDGVSLRPLLEGKKDWPARTLFVHSQRVQTPVKWKNCAALDDRWRLINGKELYDLEADPGQGTDLASRHPERVKELRAGYEAWWKDISGRFGEMIPLVIGAPEQPVVELTAHDWLAEVIPWDQSHVRKLPAQNGAWAVEVARPGKYRFTLRHRPAEAKFPLQAATARLTLGGAEVRADVPAGADGVTLEVELKAGRGQLWTWLEEKGGAKRGAFYVEARRME